MEFTLTTGLIGLLITISTLLVRALLVIHKNKHDISKNKEDIGYIKAALKSTKLELKNLIANNVSEIKEIVRTNKLQDDVLEKRVNEMAQGLVKVETKIEYLSSEQSKSKV